MNTCINPKLKQWLWFIGLWCIGLSAMLCITIPIKLMIALTKSG